MKRHHGAFFRSFCLIVVSVLALFTPSPSDAAPVRRRAVRVQVNAHRRAGFWRGVRIGAAVAVLPAGHVALTVAGARYFYYGGAFYAPAAAGYVVVAPPVGAVIAAVPEGCVAAPFGGIGYHYCAGTYYAPAAGGFAVVTTPIGITVDELPLDCAETVAFDGVDHYSCAGIYYRPLVRDGATMYVTVKR